MEYLTATNTVLKVISSIGMIIYTIILVNKHFIKHKNIANKDLLEYVILCFIYTLSR